MKRRICCEFAGEPFFGLTRSVIDAGAAEQRRDVLFWRGFWLGGAGRLYAAEWRLGKAGRRAGHRQNEGSDGECDGLALCGNGAVPACVNKRVWKRPSDYHSIGGKTYASPFPLRFVCSQRTSIHLCKKIWDGPGSAGRLTPSAGMCMIFRTVPSPRPSGINCGGALWEWAIRSNDSGHRI